MGKIYLGEHLVGLDWGDTGDTFERVSPWKNRVQALHTWEEKEEEEALGTRFTGSCQ